METDKILGKFYSICGWFIKIIYLNLVWLFFSACGLIIFGLFPATFAMFAVTRKWIQRNEDNHFFHLFLSTFKKDFWKANLFGLIFSLIGIALYLDIMIIQSYEGVFAFYLFCFIIVICLLCFATLLFLLPLYVHIELSIIQYFKQTFLIVFASPLNTVIMLGSVFLICLFFMIFSGLILFVAGSLISVIVTAIAHKSFRKLSVQ
ncbi:YesL family protein [Pseudalkalibacillus decolorationis]|uniref:YesL family protein n=1 Tax=Pseudalkalibacillus decolorationis TaxID=163879 RepID=UPI00214996CD|nr:YesL family protein [Pseudalkalibacillus decolorationis]